MKSGAPPDKTTTGRKGSFRQHYAEAFDVTALVLLALVMASRVYAQSIAGYSYPYGTQQSLTSGGTVYINPADSHNFPMPEVAFYISNRSNYPTCSYIKWTVSVAWTDPHGYQTSGSVSATDSCAASWSPAWTDDLDGTATVSATLYNCSGGQVGTTGHFTFYIKGYNQSKAQTDGNEGSLPWFGSRTIEVESCCSGDQFAPSTGFCGHSADVQWDPLWGSPDGIGLMQPDRTQNPQVFSNCTYWNFACNISSGEQVLSSTKSGAYSYWSTQVQDMKNATGGRVVAAPITICAGSDFSYPQTGAYNYEDAEWLKRYNGGYYIFWSNGQWHTSDTNNYLHNVCNASPY